jgi:hypothetical protein
MTATPRVRLWGTISGMLVFGLTLPLWTTLRRVETLYVQAGVAELPWVTELTIDFGSLLWIPAAAGWLLRLVKVREGDPALTAAWFFRMTIAIVIVQVLILLALYYPILKAPSP